MDKYRKFIVAGLAFVLTLVTQLIDAGLVTSAKWTTYAQIFISLAGAYGVFAVPNAPKALVAPLPPEHTDPFTSGH